MLTRIRRVLNDRTGRHYGLVLSAGRTATQWLTRTLNAYDGIYCTHGQDLSATRCCEVSDFNEKVLSNLDNADRFDWDDVDRYFDLLERAGPQHRVFINVHGIMSAAPYTHPRQFRRRYVAMAMVRHPISRIRSFVGKWTLDGGRTMRKRLSQSDVDRISEICRQRDIDPMDDATLCFLRAVENLTVFDKYYFGSGVPIIVTERLTTDPIYFRNIFDRLTSGAIAIDERPCSDVIGASRLDQMFEMEDAAAIKRTWLPWQQEYFDESMWRSGLYTSYRNLGYDLYI